MNSTSQDPRDSLYFSKGSRMRIVLDRGSINNTFSLTWKAIAASSICCWDIRLFMAPNLTMNFDARGYYTWDWGAKMFVYEKENYPLITLKPPWGTWNRRYPWKLTNISLSQTNLLLEFGPAVGCPHWVSRINGTNANSSSWNMTCQSGYVLSTFTFHV